MREFKRTFVSLIAVSLAVLGCDRTVVRDDQTNMHPESRVATDQTEQLPDQQLNQAESSRIGQWSDRHGIANPTSVSSLPVSSPPEVEKRYVAIRPTKSEDPVKMLEHIAEIDRLIQDLLLTPRKMDEQAGRQAAIELSQLKLEASQHLSQLSTATPEQSIMGIKSQLVALSHLSGLKDVQSARKLEELAKTLLEHPNSELRHQGQVVLFGFEIQNLQNGILKDASQIVQSAKEMLAEPRFRTRLEMTSITHALNVLYQMGFLDEAGALEEASFQAFSDSYDRELRYESWNQLTRRSPYVENFLSSLQTIKDKSSDSVAETDSTAVLAAARGLLQEHANPVTLEMIAGVIPDVEYGGYLQLSTDLTTLVDSELGKFSPGISSRAISATLTEHRQRLRWLDRDLELPSLVDVDGKSLDSASLKGKVLLVDFWATWCLPCLQEMPNLKQLVEELSVDGFTVLSINMDKDESRLKQFLQDQKFPWPTYRSSDGDTKTLTDQFGITLFPHTMLVNRHGKVVGLHVRGTEARKRILQLLQEEL